MNETYDLFRAKIEEKFNQLKSDPHYQELSSQNKSTTLFNNTIDSLLEELKTKNGNVNNEEVIGLKMILATLDNCISIQTMTQEELEKSNDCRLEEIYNKSLKYVNEMKSKYEYIVNTNMDDIPEEYRAIIYEDIEKMRLSLDNIQGYMESLESFKNHFNNDSGLALLQLNILKNFNI